MLENSQRNEHSISNRWSFGPYRLFLSTVFRGLLQSAEKGSL
jgi:hypothetical protein